MTCSLRSVAIALGSNQGDRESQLRYALTQIKLFLNDVVFSVPIETKPEGVGEASQRYFLNSAAVGWSNESPNSLLKKLQLIENSCGRVRPFPGSPRTLDLDLILVGELVICTPELILPHPRFRERQFVLGPLASIAPYLVDPVTTCTVRELLVNLKQRQETVVDPSL